MDCLEDLLSEEVVEVLQTTKQDITDKHLPNEIRMMMREVSHPEVRLTIDLHNLNHKTEEGEDSQRSKGRDKLLVPNMNFFSTHEFPHSHIAGVWGLGFGVWGLGFGRSEE